MLYITGLLLILLLGYLALQWWANAKPRSIAKLVLGLAIGVGIGLAGLLLVTGKLALALPIFLSALGALWRQRWVLNWILRSYLERRRLNSDTVPEEVHTACLIMRLDKQSGRLSGKVSAGPAKGRTLDTLDAQELAALAEHLAAHDPEGAGLLKTYMARRRASADPEGGISRSEALAILGLEDRADEKAIIAAHRRLNARIHPDQGGSDYLAAKINQAKDFLLGR